MGFSSLIIKNDSQPEPSAIEDFDGDQAQELMVKFDRQKIISALEGYTGELELAIDGKYDGDKRFMGSDIIRVKK